MKEIILKNLEEIKINCPESLDELTNEQFAKLCYFTADTGLIVTNPSVFIVSFFNLEERLITRLLRKNYREIIKNLGFLFDFVEDFGNEIMMNKLFLREDIYKTFFQEFKFEDKKIIGLQDFYNNCSVERFAWIETFFSQYLKNKEKDILINMIACMYSFEKDGLAENFEIEKVKLVLPYIKKLSEIYHKAIYTNYLFIRKSLQKTYPKIFSPDKNSMSNKGEKVDSWLDVILLSRETVEAAQKLGEQNLHMYFKKYEFDIEKAAKEELNNK